MNTRDELLDELIKLQSRYDALNPRECEAIIEACKQLVWACDFVLNQCGAVTEGKMAGLVAIVSEARRASIRHLKAVSPTPSVDGGTQRH